MCWGFMPRDFLTRSSTSRNAGYSRNPIMNSGMPCGNLPGKRNTVLSTNAFSIDPQLGVEANISHVFYLRGGIKNFQRGLDDRDSLNQKKVWLYQPSVGAGFHISNVTIDYAFSNLSNQGEPLFTHVFSLKLDMVHDKNKKKK